MKSTALAVLTIILAAAMVQAAKKRPTPKFCVGKNNIKYKPNQGYTEGCTQFLCVKKGKKIKMTSKPVPKCAENKLEALQSNVESLLGMITTMQSTCACAKPKFNLVLTAGINSGGWLATSVIIGPGGVCSQSIPPLPVAVRTPQSVYFNNMLMVFGRYMKGYRNKCQKLHYSNSQWTEGPTMNTPRVFFSMTKAGQDLYALGGNGPGAGDSIEQLSGSSGEWTMMEQKLTSPRNSHCTVFMETTRSLVIIGGYPSTNLVEEFSLDTSSWEELAPLPVALYGHACLQLDQRIVVTGGYKLQKNVYTFAGGNWEMTGELQVARYYHSMGTLDKKLLVLGGYVSGVGNVDTIEEMKEDGSFQTIEWKLNEKRAYSAITQVPRQMFPC